MRNKNLTKSQKPKPIMEVIKPKFEIGQRVWTISEQKAVEKEIRTALVLVTKIGQSVTYTLVGESEFSMDNYETWEENRLFATKEDLKKSIFGE